LLLKRLRAGRDTHKFLAMDESVALVTGKNAERQGCAAVLAIAIWLYVGGGHDGPGERGLRCWRRGGGAGCKRAQDLDLGPSRKPPSDIHPHKKNHEAKRAIERIFQFKKWRSESQKCEEAERLE